MTEPDSKDTKTTETPVAAETPATETPASEASNKGAAALEEQLAAAKKEAAENYNRYLRAVADLENARKRAIREKDELRQYAATKLLEDLIPVLDSLALGLNAAKLPAADSGSIISGMEMVINQLKNALAGHGMKEINPASQPFDPHQHEAISHIPSAEVAVDHVIAVVRTGYSLNGRLLRPASVVVSSGPAPEEPAQ